MDHSQIKDLDWRELCRQASEEKDPDRLIEIVRQLNRALEESRRRPHGRSYGMGAIIHDMSAQRSVPTCR